MKTGHGFLANQEGMLPLISNSLDLNAWSSPGFVTNPTGIIDFTHSSAPAVPFTARNNNDSATMLLLLFTD